MLDSCQKFHVLWDDKNAWAAVAIQELCKGHRHGLEILRHEYAIVLCSNLKNFGIRETAQSCVFSRSKIDIRLSPLDADNNSDRHPPENEFSRLRRLSLQNLIESLVELWVPCTGFFG